MLTGADLIAFRVSRGMTTYALAKKLGRSTKGVRYLEMRPEQPVAAEYPLLLAAIDADLEPYVHPGMDLPRDSGLLIAAVLEAVQPWLPHRAAAPGRASPWVRTVASAA